MGRALGPSPRIVILGIGGGGSSAVNRMIGAGVRGVEFVAINTDAQALARVQAPTRLHVGERLTHGLGAGGTPNTGGKAAEESAAQLAELVRDADVVFVVAGLGGGTGTGAAPVLARIARAAGALTLGVVTQPFSFEGRQRQKHADAGTIQLLEQVDALVTVPNDQLLQILDRRSTLEQAFGAADDVLCQAIQGISDLFTQPGPITLDVADVQTFLRQSGTARLAIGRGTGQARAMHAAHMAISSPLLNGGLEAAKGVLLTITGGADLAVSEIHEAVEVLAQAVAPDTTVVFGAVTDLRLAREVRITLLATGGPPYRQPEGASGLLGSGPPPPDSAPLGARLPRRPQAPSDHAAALPPTAPQPQDEPVRFLVIPPILSPAPAPPGTGQEPDADTGESDYLRAS